LLDLGEAVHSQHGTGAGSMFVMGRWLVTYRLPKGTDRIEVEAAGPVAALDAAKLLLPDSAKFTDLPNAWIAPPDGFVGSADLVAELRLSNGKIVDRQAMHIEWMTPVSPAPARSEFDTQLQPRQDVQPKRITDAPHVAFLPLPQVVPQSSGAKSITVESRAEPGIANSTCFASAAAVRQDHPEAWPSWTLRAFGHEGTKCWYPTARTLAHDHPK
jgi:hypothetical protein